MRLESDLKKKKKKSDLMCFFAVQTFQKIIWIKSRYEKNQIFAGILNMKTAHSLMTIHILQLKNDILSIIL